MVLIFYLRLFFPDGQLSNFERLAHPEVFVNFEFEEHYQIGSSKFSLEPKVIYHNEKLDIAVLQLKTNGMTHPPPFIRFDEFTREIHEKDPIYLIGHSESKKKSMNCVLKYWEPFEHRINELTTWSEEEFDLKHGFGYTGIGKDNRLHFKCSFRHGASGCPGLLVRPGGEVLVVTVLLRGFPDFYYYDNFTDEERQRVPTGKLIQQGSNMKTIMDDMKNKNQDLYEEIFFYEEKFKKESMVTSSGKKELKLEIKPGLSNSAESKGLVLCTPEVTSKHNAKILPSSQIHSHPVAEDEANATGLREPDPSENSGEVQNKDGCPSGENTSPTCSSSKPTNNDRLQNPTSEGEGTGMQGCTSDIADPSESSNQEAALKTVQPGKDESSPAPPTNSQGSEAKISTSNSQCSESRYNNSTKSANESKVW